MKNPQKSTGSGITVNNRRSRIFVIGFVVVMLAALATAITTNLLRRPETEAAAASAQAGQQLLQRAKTGVIPVPQNLKFEPLEIQTAKGPVPFRIEFMRTPEEQARGLMFRQTLADDQGMLFDFGVDRPVTMWMKNTYLPLDMIFATSDGRIHRIEENTEPFSERTIASGVAVRAVLEVKAGTARRYGIKPGDRLVHGMFVQK